MLRAATLSGNELGSASRVSWIRQLVPDDIIIDMIADRIGSQIAVTALFSTVSRIAGASAALDEMLAQHGRQLDHGSVTTTRTPWSTGSPDALPVSSVVPEAERANRPKVDGVVMLAAAANSSAARTTDQKRSERGSMSIIARPRRSHCIIGERIRWSVDGMAEIDRLREIENPYRVAPPPQNRA
jgi:hypothetical protein